MNPLESLPLLVVVLLLLAGGGADVDDLTVQYDGDRALTDGPDVLVVAGGEATVPAATTTPGPLYVIGGSATVAGTVEGDVVLLAGNLTVADGGAVTGELAAYGGSLDLDDGATVGTLTTLPTSTAADPAGAGPGWLALQAVVLGGAAGLLARRRPRALATVGDAVREHPVVVGTVGALTGATALVLLVFMAFTVVLLPVTVLGLAAGAVTAAYGYVAVGALAGRRLPVARPDVGAALGTVGLVVAMALVGRVPVVGPVVQFGVLAAGLGAVVVTYFGLRPFEPPTLPEAPG